LNEMGHRTLKKNGLVKKKTLRNKYGVEKKRGYKRTGSRDLRKRARRNNRNKKKVSKKKGYGEKESTYGARTGKKKGGKSDESGAAGEGDGRGLGDFRSLKKRRRKNQRAKNLKKKWKQAGAKRGGEERGGS